MKPLQRVPGGRAGVMRLLRAVLGALALPVLLCLALLPTQAEAQINRAFTTRYSGNINGDVKLVGNTLATCNPAGTNGGACAGSQQGTGTATALNNDNFASMFIDIDGDPNTFNSSTSVLSIPATSTILWAGLYWGGQGTTAAIASPQRAQALLKGPTAGGYTTVFASVVDDIAPVTTGGNTTPWIYGAFADVTSYVKAAGIGSYTVANVQSDDMGNAATYGGQWTGWGLVVVYSDNSQPLRNVVVYDGFARILGAEVNLTPSGFLTPLTGPVSTRVGSIGYDGDLGLTGDNFAVNGTNLVDALNIQNNYFNSSLSDNGVLAATNTPGYANQLGFDVDRSNVPAGVIPNGATSAALRLFTTGDAYYPQVITFSTDIYVPIITPNLTKTATDLNGGYLVPGDIIRWTISMNNTGQDGGTNLVLTDPIPPNTTYVPGSLNIRSGANAGAKTDAGGDDQGLFASGAVKFFLGQGATATQGGNLPPGAATSVSFDTVVGVVPSGTVITNTASISYSGQTLSQTSFSSSSTATSLTVMGPPLAEKTFNPISVPPGGSSQLKIVISNPAGNPGAITGASFNDTYPANLVNTATPNAQISCTAGATAGTLTGGTAGGNTIGMSGASIPPNGNCTVTVNVTSATNGAYTNSTGPITSTNAGSGTAATANLAIGKIDISKAFSQASNAVSPASTTLTFTLTNRTGAAVAGMSFTDALPGGLVVAATPGATVAPACGGGTLTAVAGANSVTFNNGGNTTALADGGVCTVSVNVSGATPGIYNNTSGGVSYTIAGNPFPAGPPSNTATLTLIATPVVTKSFNPPAIANAAGTNSTLTITIRNPDANATIRTAGTVFTDTYPTTGNPAGTPGNLTNVNPRNVSLGCDFGSSASFGTVANGSIAIQNLTLLPGATCTMSAVVQVSSATAGNYPNTVTAAFDGLPSVTASATLVTTANAGPTVAKTFNGAAAASIPVNGTATLGIRLTAGAVALTNVSFSDVYPVGVTNTTGTVTLTPSAAGACAGAVATASAGGNSLSLTGLNLPANQNCLLSIPVTSGQAGTYVNNTGQVTASNARSSASVSATLNVVSPPSITKSFSPNPVAPNTNSTLTITITNPAGNASSLSGLTFTDTYPANLVNAAAPTDNCAGANATGAAGGNSVGISGAGALAAGASCTITVNVRSATAGVYANTTSLIASTEGGNGNAASDTLTVGRLSVAKSFNPTTISNGDTSLITFQIGNGTSAARTGLAFSDTLTNMQVLNGTVGGTCTGVVTNAAPGVTNFQVTAGNVPIGGCTITINVTSTVSGTWQNQTSGATYTGDATPGAPSNIAYLTVAPPPTITKSFSPAQVPRNGVSTLTFTIFNASPTSATNAGFTDTYPGGLVNASPPAVTNSCGGTVTATAGGNSLVLSNGVLPLNSNCNITVNVTSATTGNYNNSLPAGALTSSQGSNASGTQATLSVLQPLVVSKSFTPSTIVAGGSANMTISLLNPNSVPVSGGAFVDTYPAGLSNASPAGAATSCAGATVTPGTGNLTVSNATVGANASCTVSVNVTANAGAYTNTIPAGGVTTGSAGSNTQPASASLSVAQPSIAKAFNPTTINAGGPTRLTFTLTNPTGTAAAAVQFSDTYPGGIVNASPNGLTSTCTPGTVTAAAGAGTLSYTGGTIPANGSCTIGVNVVGGATPGTYTNQTAGFAGTGFTGNTATANITIMGAPTVTKAFSQPSAGTGVPVALTITLNNPNQTAITGAGFTDTYPSGLINAPSPAGATSCTGGSVTAAAGGGSVALAGATIPASGSCTVTVNVLSNAAGTYNNTIGAGGVTSANAPASTAPASASLTTLNGKPTVAKAFNPTGVALNANSTLTITLSNPLAVAMTGVSFTDNYPTGLINHPTAPNAATTCTGGAVAAAAGGSSLGLGNGTIPAGGSCTVTVIVRPTATGNLVNNTGPVTTANAGTGDSATATLVGGMTRLAVSKSFNPVSGANTNPNPPTQLTITLTNPNAAPVTGVTFTDDFPGTMVVAPAVGYTESCTPALGTAPAAGAGAFTLTNATIPANTTCTISFNVRGTTLNTVYTNQIPSFTPSNAPATAVAQATYTIGNPGTPSGPTITKVFNPGSVTVGTGATLTFNITNSAGANATNLAFTDTYPTNITNVATPAATNTCGGTLTANTGAGTLSLAGGTLAAGASCAITKTVSASAAGAYTNVSGTVSATISGNTRNGNTASDSLTVTQPALLSIAKAFNPATINANAPSTVTFTLANPGTADSTGTSFSDTLSPASGLRISGAQSAAGSCVGAGGNNFANNAAGTLNFTGLTVPAGGSCTVTVVMTSSVPGTWANATSGVTNAAGTGTASNTANLTVNAIAPTITKAFSPASITAGGTSTVTLTLSNTNTVQLTGAAFTDTLNNMQIAATPAVGGTCTGVSATANTGAGSFTLNSANIPASGSCTITFQVTSNTVGTLPNATSGITTDQTPTAGSQSNTANLTVLSNGGPVSGTVYADANTNGTLDNGETWNTGTTVFVNLVSGGVVVQSLSVPAGTGAYTFGSVPAGNYTVVLTNTATSTTAVAPSGWFFTGPTDGTINTAIGPSGLAGLNFGLRSGPRITGTVFRDVGNAVTGAGATIIANDGIMQAGESPANAGLPYSPPLGISGAALSLTDCAGNTYSTTTTDASGNYSFAVPGGLTSGSSPLCVVQGLPSNYVASGASVGSQAIPSNSAAVTVSGVAYTYCRGAGTACSVPAGAVAPGNALRFTYNSGATYTDLNFGDVPAPTFAADQASAAQPGTTVNYASMFTPGSYGSVTFNVTRTTLPASPAWNEVLYRDSNCNGLLDGSEAPVTGSFTLNPNDTTNGDPNTRRICLILREFVPPSAPIGAVNKATINAAFTYLNSNTNTAAPAGTTTLTVTDTTTSGSATGGDGLRLRKEVCNVTTTTGAGCVPALTGANAGNGFSENNVGRSGDELMYRIIYSNASANDLGTLVINDTTPPFTVRSPATAPAYGTTPAGLLCNGSPACTLTAAPAAGASGAFSWSFTGTLRPNAQGVVTFNVVIQ